MSGRTPPAHHRFSRQGFQPLPSTSSASMANPNDATIDIPLTTVTTRGQTGARKAEDTLEMSGHISQPSSSNQHLNEKAGLFHRHIAGRRRIKNKDSDGGAGSRGYGEEEDTLTQMGKLYNKVMNFSIITRYFVYVLPLAALIAVPIVIGATAAQHARLGGVRIVWLFTWIEVVWLSLWISKVFARSLPSVFQFLCGIVSSGTRKYALVLKSLEIPLSLAGWALASLATFIPLMTRTDSAARDVRPWQLIIQRILAALMVASLVFLAEKLLVQLISISYHRKQFDAKIKESKHNVYLLSLLYDASRALFPAYCPEFAEEDYAINASIEIAAIKKGSGHARSGSATPLRLIQNVGRVGDKITAAFGNVAHEITGKQVFNPTAAHSVVVEALEKIKSSEALAKRLWMSFVIEGKDALYEEDIMEVLGPDRKAEAEECFAALDKDGNGDVSLDEMILTVCEFGRQRHSIANSMHDVDQAITVLDKLLCTIVAIISIFVFVAFLNSSFTTTLATAGTALLSMSFVFATTAQEVLGSCIFLFVKHPFDVGDRVDIGDEQLTVERISLLFTVFKKLKNHKTTQVPNIVLNTNWIDNISRSKAMREQILMYIHFDTSLEDIQLLRNEMQAFVLDKDNCRDFQPDIDVEVTGIAEMNKMELRVEIRHKSNWANETVRAARRSKFMCALVLALRKVPIYAPGAGDAALGDVSKPTYSVAVTDAEAAANRDAFAAKKEAKRLVPSKKPNVPKTDEDSSKSTGADLLGTHSNGTLRGRSNMRPTEAATNANGNENTVVETLNARPPAFDPARDHDDWDAGHYRDESSSSNSTLGEHDRERMSSDEARRSNDIEEVRSLLHREPTKGRRKRAPTAAAVPGVASIVEVDGSGHSDGVSQEDYRRGYTAQTQNAAYSGGVQQQVGGQYPAQAQAGGIPRQGQYASPMQQPQQQQQVPPQTYRL